jgi:hypothetical protein
VSSLQYDPAPKPLTDRERQLLQRMFSDFMEVPGEWKTDLSSWLESNPPQLGIQALAGQFPTVRIVRDMSIGPPPNPVNGDVWVATNVDALGTIWEFRYNANSASAYKWEFMGGTPLLVSSVGGVTTTTTGYIDLTGGPTLTAPRAGDYWVDWGVLPVCTAFTAVYFAQAITAFAAATSPALNLGVPLQWSNAPFAQGHGFNAQALGDVLKIRMQNDRAGGGTTTWSQGWLKLTPRRVS